MMWVIIASLGIVLAAMTIPSDAEAATYNKFITISRDRTCVIVDCILVKDLIKYDTSNRKISGDFIISPSGDYIRTKGMPNHGNWYFANSKNNTVVFVETDGNILVRSKQIIIQPSLKEYAPTGKLSKVDHTFGKSKTVTYTGVYVDPKCQVANVGIKQYPNIAKIVEHLVSGCSTDLENKNVNITNKTKLNYCGQECQHQKFMREAKILAKSKIIIAGKP